MRRDRRMQCRSALLLILIAAFAATASVASATDVLLLPPKSSARWRGSDPPCTVRLRDTREYGLAPMTPAAAGRIQGKWLAVHRLAWSGSRRVTFRTCPPVKALLIGDSLAFSMGLGIAIDEEQYGVEVANAAVLACSFTTNGFASRPSGWEPVSSECADPLTRWTRIERAIASEGRDH